MWFFKFIFLNIFFSVVIFFSISYYNELALHNTQLLKRYCSWTKDETLSKLGMIFINLIALKRSHHQQLCQLVLRNVHQEMGKKLRNRRRIKGIPFFVCLHHSLDPLLATTT